MDLYNKINVYGMTNHGNIDGFSHHIIWMESFYTNSDPKVNGLLHKHSDTY